MPKTVTYAPAHHPDRPDLSAEEIDALAERMLADLEQWVGAEQITGTELMVTLMAVCHRLLADSQHTPAERVEIWRACATGVEALLVNDLH